MCATTSSTVANILLCSLHLISANSLDFGSSESIPCCCRNALAAVEYASNELLASWVRKDEPKLIMMTPPLAARALISSSLMLRSQPGVKCRQEECEAM